MADRVHRRGENCKGCRSCVVLDARVESERNGRILAIAYASSLASAGLAQKPYFQGKTGVPGSGGAVGPVLASLSDWLDGCPVDLDEATRDRIWAMIGDGQPAITGSQALPGCECCRATGHPMPATTRRAAQSPPGSTAVPWRNANAPGRLDSFPMGNAPTEHTSCYSFISGDIDHVADANVGLKLLEAGSVEVVTRGLVQRTIAPFWGRSRCSPAVVGSPDAGQLRSGPLCQCGRSRRRFSSRDSPVFEDLDMTVRVRPSGPFAAMRKCGTIPADWTLSPVCK